MRACKRHPAESQPSGGVCARCLEQRLTWLWRGESFRHEDPEQAGTSSSSTTSVAVDSELEPELLLRVEPRCGPDAAAPELSPEVVAASSSFSSVRKQLQVLGVASRPVSSHDDTVESANHPNGGGLNPVATSSSLPDPSPRNSTTSQNSNVAIMEEWAEFHARRRRSLEQPGSLDYSPKAKSSRSLDSIESVEPMVVDRTESNVSTERNPELRILMNAQKMHGSRLMPLDNRSAEETALRVINEQADNESGLYSEELDMYVDESALQQQDRDGGGEALQEEELQRCFSPVWQSRRSPKWVKVLASPMTSRNRVFPSRSKEADVRKGRSGSRNKRGARFDSSDWGFKEATGGMSPLWRGSSARAEDQRLHRELALRDGDAARQRTSSRSRSVFSWLQDAETAQFKKYDQREQGLTSSSSSSLTNNSVSTDSWLRDLTTVGHLHEIAEELEIVEESSEEEDGGLGDVSSFGKFLLIAAERHPHARLTRLVSSSGTSNGESLPINNNNVH